MQGLTYGLKPIPFKTEGKARVLQQTVKSCPFKEAAFRESVVVPFLQTRSSALSCVVKEELYSATEQLAEKVDFDSRNIPQGLKPSFICRA
jgi:hypothetical protein